MFRKRSKDGASGAAKTIVDNKPYRSVRQSIKSMIARDAFGDEVGESEIVPTLLIFGYLEARSAKEAEKYVRSLAEKRAAVPVAVGYTLMSFGRGFAYEVQEGGSGFSLLPQIVDMAKTASPGVGSRLYGRSQDRIVEVTVRPHSIQCLILPESAPGLPDGDVEWLMPSKRKLKPLMKTGMPVFMGGLFLFCFSLAALSAVGGVFAFMSRTPQIPPVVLPYSSLPIEQWSMLTSDQSRYVQALHWQNGHWQIVWSPEQDSLEGLVKSIVDDAVAKVDVGGADQSPDPAMPSDQSDSVSAGGQGKALPNGAAVSETRPPAPAAEPAGAPSDDLPTAISTDGNVPAPPSDTLRQP